ncbi:I78 family peptidase inhibitor [Chromohalobacter israelensis]|uniref:I78 family peptidase inhibitor n=1 Tax=Chromohalobacter israelensis TaxID=141390 RepID=UPI00068F83C4|nr:I78 family peptidase inhibitor [Chromohalobacter israelensis]MDF9434743.1 I78 family peptidase inhibitor [Chromohalobacter israelensis]
MYRIGLGGALLTILLAGCSAGQTPDEAPTPPSTSQRDACGADALNDYQGRRATESTLARLEEESDAERVRVVGPNQAVTMDYRAQRLNVKLDDRQRIVELTCG